jgi:hypothetical protein
MTIEEAKERVTIAALWHEFGYPGEPRKSCRCPFHDDRTPSFSIYDNGQRWKCHTGCGEGDVINFFARAKGLSNEEACREILRRVIGVYRSGAKLHHDQLLSSVSIQLSAQRESLPKSQVVLPRSVPYSREIAQRAADSRGLSITAVEFAALWLKTLSFARVCNQRCWVLSDASRHCAEARRIDGESFPALGSLTERKGHALAGSCKSWPVGILPPGFEEEWLEEHVKKIVLVEGGPDYLAACQLIAEQDVNVLPITMLGASQNIAEDARAYFAERQVTIVAHPDEEGRDAAIRWARQIQAVDGRARIFNLRQDDLCDVVAAGATYNELQLF